MNQLKLICTWDDIHDLKTEIIQREILDLQKIQEKKPEKEKAPLIEPQTTPIGKPLTVKLSLFKRQKLNKLLRKYDLKLNAININHADVKGGYIVLDEKGNPKYKAEKLQKKHEATALLLQQEVELDISEYDSEVVQFVNDFLIP